MMLPRWISRIGLAEHALAGLLLSGLFLVLGFSHFENFTAILGIGIAHEMGDGDFVWEAGAPWNGTIDALFFVIFPALIWAFL